jgi:nucleotide-binding universal stress UspA family protein
MTTRLNHFLNEPEQLDAILLDFSGDPRDKILEHVNVEMAKSIDMLVIGNRTSSKLTKTLGSTAQYLLHHANVPVMMIPDSLLQDYSNDEEWQSYPE